MSALIGTYDPKKVNLIVDGYTVSGFADGTFIKVERVDPEVYKVHVGAHGEVGRTRNPNKTGKVTFTLKGTSPSNVIIDAGKNLSIPIAFAIINKSDQSFAAAATNAWLSKDPTVEFGMEETNIEWEITCDELNKAFI
jgi:hypothetical protein